MENEDLKEELKENEEEQEEKNIEKLNRKQRRALNSKRRGDSQGTNKDKKTHINRITEKPKARRR